MGRHTREPDRTKVNSAKMDLSTSDAILNVSSPSLVITVIPYQAHLSMLTVLYCNELCSSFLCCCSVLYCTVLLALEGTYIYIEGIKNA